MRRIPVPNTSYSEVEVTIEGQTFLFQYRFNERSSRWKVDIYDSNGNAVKKGMTCLENFTLNLPFTLDNFPNGILYVGTLRNTKEPCGFSNFGIDKTYEMIYASFEELDGS